MSFAYYYSLYAPNEEVVNKEVKGVLSIEGEELLFEYKLYDMMGNVISTLNKFSIDVQYLKDVSFKKGFFKNRMIIETTKMVFLDPLPGSSQGKIKLHVKRSDRNNAQSFSQKLSIALSERRLNELE
jgi:hypothetical protein